MNKNEESCKCEQNSSNQGPKESVEADAKSLVHDVASIPEGVSLGKATPVIKATLDSTATGNQSWYNTTSPYYNGDFNGQQFPHIMSFYDMMSALRELRGLLEIPHISESLKFKLEQKVEEYIELI